MAFGAAFLRAVRFSFLRSVLSVNVLRVHQSLLQSCVFFHQLLQSVAREIDRDLSILALPFAPDHRSGAVLGVLYYCTCARGLFGRGGGAGSVLEPRRSPRGRAIGG